MNPEPAFGESSRDDRERVEVRCQSLVDQFASHHTGMHNAIQYVLLGGGKRLRPLLCLWTHDFVGGNSRDAALDAACAVEFVHTYSLVHDDLPCMDNDDLRRGRESAHVRFGEAAAVLTGDALLTLAFEVLSTLPDRHAGLDAGAALGTVRVLTSAAGTGGLISGQALDIESEGASAATEAEVERIHRNKTGRLIAAAMELGALAGGADASVRRNIAEAGLLAGVAFQIVDDLLDFGSQEGALGKTPGKDRESEKLTYPSVVGVQGARRRAADLVENAKHALSSLGGDPARLCSALDFFVERMA